MFRVDVLFCPVDEKANGSCKPGQVFFFLRLGPNRRWRLLVFSLFPIRGPEPDWVRLLQARGLLPENQRDEASPDRGSRTGMLGLYQAP